MLQEAERQLRRRRTNEMAHFPKPPSSFLALLVLMCLSSDLFVTRVDAGVGQVLLNNDRDIRWDHGLSASVSSADDEEYDDEDGVDKPEKNRRVPPSNYRNPNAQDFPEDHECRDDAYISCEEVQMEGNCGEPGDLINFLDLCPVTCGKCEFPKRSAVWTDFECFAHNEDIPIFFTNTDPDEEDFIGIYPSYVNFQEDPSQLEQGYMWMYTCGSMHENCKTAMGGLLFGDMGPDDDQDWLHWPLPGGTYKAALARSDDGGLIAESTVFTIKPQGHSCYFECKELVYADQPCYSDEDSIYVTFENCQPREDDRVAIYPATVGAHPGDLAPPLWLGTCGDQMCSKIVTAEGLEFGPGGADESGTISWPLPEGEYKAFLIRMNEGDQFGRKLAESSTFTMMPPGEKCSGVSEDL